MAVADSHDTHDDHHDLYDHGEFIAHHFDSAEQQFDSGKLGIWLFLVTEFCSSAVCLWLTLCTGPTIPRFLSKLTSSSINTSVA